MLNVRVASLTDIERIHAMIPEFDPVDLNERLAGKDYLLLSAEDGGTDTGYCVAYLLNEEVAYIWLAAVVPAFRHKGVFQQLYAEVFTWAKSKNCTSIRLKTHNRYRGMLAWLVKNGFFFIEIETMDDPLFNRILTEKFI